MILGNLNSLNKCEDKVRPHFRLYNMKPFPLFLSEYVISSRRPHFRFIAVGTER